MKTGMILFFAGMLAWPLLTKAQQDSAAKKVQTMPKSYDEFVTKAATQKGLITVHKLEDKYYFELPASLLERDLLVVTRISKSAAKVRPFNGMLGYAGDQLGEKVIRFTKDADKKIFIRRVMYAEQSSDTSLNGMRRSVMNSNLFSIVAAFDIKYYSRDSGSYIIEIGDYINSEKDYVFFDKLWKAQFGMGAQEADKSYIEGVYAYPMNAEMRVVRTFAPANGSGYLSTFELNASIIALPVKLMRPRSFDMRIGYFGKVLTDFDKNPHGVEDITMITRWRLEPKEGEEARYLQGELVEPRQPIVYYIDPATPKKWVPYLMEGVNAWQQAFEKAGFKNAIYALEAPANDSSWNVYDARHNVIVYKPSIVQNASGPQVSDPRTGEILETHINWYHNVMQLLHDWYMIQAGAIDPAARKYSFNDTLMGKLIRYVCTHEVGHTLGLTHNMAASYSIPVDKLRDRHWLETNSHTPSVMDYARFNFVAQPEDSIPLNSLIPRIGPYDEWAIEWGYRWLGNKMTKQEEQAWLSNWLSKRIKQDPRLWYGFELLLDPRVQAEDLGDNQMEANKYGIKNLKRILPDIATWMKDTNNPVQSYNDIRLIYGQVLIQYRRYLNQVANYIGNWYTSDRTVAEGGNIYEFVSREKQREAVEFLCNELFNTPQWLLGTQQFAWFNEAPMVILSKVQEELLQKIMSTNKLAWMLISEATFPGKGYQPAGFFSDLKRGIWTELATKKPVDIYRRNLQKMYVKSLTRLLADMPVTGTVQGKLSEEEYTFLQQSDLKAIVREHVSQLDKEIVAARERTGDTMTRLHFSEVHNMIKNALAGGKTPEAIGATASPKTLDVPQETLNKQNMPCWSW